MNNKIDDEKLQLLQASFRNFDSDGSSSISRQELRDVMYMICDTDDASKVEEEVDLLLNACDKDGNGEITYIEFFSALKNKKGEDREAQIIAKLFDFFSKKKQDQEKIISGNKSHYENLKKDYEQMEKRLAEQEHKLKQESEEREKREREVKEHKEAHALTQQEKEEKIKELNEHIEGLNEIVKTLKGDKKDAEEHARVAREELEKTKAGLLEEIREKDKENKRLEEVLKDVRTQLAEVTEQKDHATRSLHEAEGKIIQFQEEKRVNTEELLFERQKFAYYEKELQASVREIGGIMEIIHQQAERSV